MRRWYEVDPGRPRHHAVAPATSATLGATGGTVRADGIGPDQRAGRPRQLTDAQAVAIAAAVVAGAFVPARLAPWPALALALLVWLRRRRRWWWLLVAAAGALGASAMSGAAWRAFDTVPTGPWHGPATVVGDPRPMPSFDGSRRVEVVLRVDGERYAAWLDGDAAAGALTLRGGEDVWLDGGRMYPAWGSGRRLAVRHIAGELRIHEVRPLDAGSPLARSTNRVRAAIEGSSSALPGEQAALLRALLYGDDRFLPPSTVDTMREAGLAHLTAVSGQQVALVLVVVQPLLRRLRPWLRWGAAMAVIGWFAALTRFEPSVVRAAWMAALGVTAYTTGAQHRAVRLLAITVAGMVLVDPMVVRAAGWWMSVAATLGVVVIAPRLDGLLAGPDWLRRPLAVTLGAQLAVAPVLYAVFGTPPIVGIPANLLAVPAAAFVTVAGFPVALGDAWLPGPWPIAWLPLRLALTWIVAVARLAERLEPGPPWTAVLWALIVAALAGRGALILVRYVRLRLPLAGAPVAGADP
jgi:competence protein ComEC